LKTSAAAVSAAALGNLTLARSVHAAGSDIIKIGMVGCGSRCPGAALQAMNVDPGVRLVAMTDVFTERVQSRRKMLKEQKPQQVQVDDAHCFSGLHVVAAACAPAKKKGLGVVSGMHSAAALWQRPKGDRWP
jgi:predicted homoserine dehydrogenase-like protein